ncbi:hypothetical protein PAXRUDRAFT_17056 [Paxillus rubicundulus Ve08.2h10]|uniref:Uncharacterized protein n=1 Tax=Paxillus rubicundulus Ve08.2h10 TaxID=930991 RepID=A0A0D0C4Q6_9AGAM|nr:hypothetical protein PAXRUDRAFT_17056 [Paxillus rubicundulus Ve08.2h10]
MLKPQSLTYPILLDSPYLFPNPQPFGFALETPGLNQILTKTMKESEGNPEAMDVYKIQLASAPSMKSIELAIQSECPSMASSQRGSSTWLAQGLQIQQSQIQLRLEASLASPQYTET